MAGGTGEDPAEPKQVQYPDLEAWRSGQQEKMRMGFMAKHNEKYYHVTEDGRWFLERVTGVKIMEESD